ncbi:MAG: DUF1127 domain-containing protein [Sedimenticola sp.]|nr:DUF1127 domain-containing protein [Sedimenticola sp.]
MKNIMCVDHPISAATGERKRSLSSRFGLAQAALIRFSVKVYHWHRVSKQRYELMALSDHMLKDIGISRADAEGEASRPFWDDKGIRR